MEEKTSINEKVGDEYKNKIRYYWSLEDQIREY
jgi:hypothetical protein